MHWTSYVKSLSLMGLFLASTASAAVLYEVHDLGRETFPFAINEAGLAVGASMAGAVRLQQDTPSLLLGPGSAREINDAGVIVGGMSPFHAFRWTATQGMQDLETPGDALMFFTATGINDAGTIVGYALGPQPGVQQPSPIRPVAWIAGQLMDLGTLGGQEGYAYAINAQGDIVQQFWVNDFKAIFLARK